MIWPESAGWLGLAATVLLLLVLMAVVALSRLAPALKALLVGALFLRAVGALVRHQVLFRFYGGVGDARGYYGRGLDYAASFWQLDFSPFYDSTLWRGAPWWGTNFVYYPSAIVLSFIGPTMLGEFVVFSLLSLLGLVGFVWAFRNSFPEVPLWRYALWVWLFPSLWFWPSSIGKEAIILMGIGLATAGYAGRHGSVNWLLLAVGVFFVLAVRPQVAAVLLLSMIVAPLLGGDRGWRAGRTMQGVVVLALGLGGIWLSMRTIGIESFDVEEVSTYLDAQTARAGGDSRIEAVGVGWQNIPAALRNMFLRPFPWEITNPMVAFASLEVLSLWGILLCRLRNVGSALRSWHRHRLLRVALVFLLVYSITLGMLLANLGVIARQRIFLFPFLFLFLEAVPARKGLERTARRPGPHREAQPAHNR